MDFLAENNSCGQTLLRLVSRGNAAIAELLRLKEVVPNVYRQPSKHEQDKYGELLQLDFRYFQTSDQTEERVENSDALASADDELKETYLERLGRFYRLFASVHRYVVDLKAYLDDVDEGNYIQQTLESVFLDDDGKQLLCEALYIYGVLLLLVDYHVEGPVRERLLVAYYRYNGGHQRRHADDGNVDDICKLLRSTGFSRQPGARRPANYPEQFLGRVPLPGRYVRLVLGRLRSEDLYNQIRCYPDPEHRSTALSGQAAMLYVCMYFAPDVLKMETAVMREVVDKFFPDNWVISYYMGTVVNLVDAWDPYKAAKAAMANTLQPANVRTVAIKNAKMLETMLPETERLSKEGALTEENILDHIVKILNTVRESNVVLRWVMLHTTALTAGAEQSKRCRQLRDQVISETKFQSFRLFQLLLNTAHFELKLRQMYGRLLARRARRWDQNKADCRERMAELAAVYGGEQALSRVQRNERLKKWFLEREKQMSSLDLDSPLASGRLAAQLIEAIDEALDFHQLESNLQVRESLQSTKSSLHHMIRVAGVKEDVLITLQIIGDLTYAWQIADATFTRYMQQGVQEEPHLVKKLRATFLKLSSALEGPILRISQAHSKDLVSVSQYYSSELVAYVRKVLQIIPEKIFDLMDRIVVLQTDHIREVPTRLDKDKIKDFAQLDQRFEVARLTHSISVFTEGMLAMKSTLVGVIKVDPKRLLEDGIRKEIVWQVSEAMHLTLQFNPKAKTTELPGKLASLSKILTGLRKSFEYIQDYVNVPGLKIWQEELSRIVNFNVEQEANLFLKQKVPEWDSVYQSRSVPIPRHPSNDPNTLTFIGRLTNEIVALTSPRTTVFVKALDTWYDQRSRSETAGLSLFSSLESAIGSFGLAGLDRLLGLKAVTCLQNINSGLLDRRIFRDKAWLAALDNMADSLNPTENVVAAPARFYQAFLNVGGAGGGSVRALPSSSPFATLLEGVVTLGQLQLLRRQLAYRLSLSAGFDAKLLHSALRTFNQSVLADMQKSADADASASTNQESPLLYELSPYLQWSGLLDPNKQVYVTSRPAPRLAELLFLAVVASLNRVVYSASAGGLISKKPLDPVIDGYPFTLGVICLLQQYPEAVTDKVLAYLAQYARSFSEANNASKPAEMPAEVLNVVTFLEKFCEERKDSRKCLSQLLPGPLIDLLNKNGGA